jgi:Tol biopolymer transport system component
MYRVLFFVFILTILSIPARSENLDRDLDGLTNDYEVSIGTNPDVWDTDNDGFNDGIDIFPGDSTNPSNGAKLYDIGGFVEPITQNDSSNRLAPKWSPDGKTISYVKTDLDYSNPVLCKAVVGAIDSETVITNAGDLGATYNWHIPSFNGTNDQILFDKDGKIYSALMNAMLHHRHPENPTATLILNYRDSYIDGVEENSLQIMLYNPEISEATAIPTIIDMDSNQLSARIKHFSDYGVLGDLIVPASVDNFSLYE